MYCMYYYELNVEVIKSIADYLAEPLALLFNKRTDVGIFAECLKLTKLYPVLKKGA